MFQMGHFLFPVGFILVLQVILWTVNMCVLCKADTHSAARTLHCHTQNHTKDHLQAVIPAALLPSRMMVAESPSNPEVRDNPDPPGRGGRRRGGDPDSSEDTKLCGSLETFSLVQLSLCDSLSSQHRRLCRLHRPRGR